MRSENEEEDPHKDHREGDKNDQSSEGVAAATATSRSVRLPARENLVKASILRRRNTVNLFFRDLDEICSRCWWWSLRVDGEAASVCEPAGASRRPWDAVDVSVNG